RRVFFFQAEDGIRDRNVTGVQTCALPICAICVNHEGCKERPLKGVSQILEGAGAGLKTRPLPPCKAQKGNYENPDEHKMPPSWFDFISLLTHIFHPTHDFPKALFARLLVWPPFVVLSIPQAPVAELADALDLGSSVLRACEFKSHRAHHAK